MVRVWHNRRVPIYPPTILDRMRSLRNARPVDDANAVASSVSFDCGSMITFSMRINKEGVIDEARFASNGCGFMLAAADELADSLSGRALTDLHGLRDEDLRGDLPQQREECIDVVLESMHKALAAYREQKLTEYAGEAALICTCFGVSEETVISVIESNGLTLLAAPASSMDLLFIFKPLPVPQNRRNVRAVCRWLIAIDPTSNRLMHFSHAFGSAAIIYAYYQSRPPSPNR